MDFTCFCAKVLARIHVGSLKLSRRLSSDTSTSQSSSFHTGTLKMFLACHTRRLISTLPVTVILSVHESKPLSGFIK